MNQLHMESVSGGYGDIVVLREISLSVSRGESVAVLGRNGVGKTTLLRTIAGLLPITRGRMWLGDHDVTSAPSYSRAKRGLSFVQEGKRIFHDQTVEQNLILGSYAKPMRRKELREQLEGAYARFPILADRRTSQAGSLSGGQQQMLAIAQALVREPSVLLLDEPSAGLAPAIVDEVYQIIADLKRDGLTLLLVEQSLPRAMTVADRLVLLDQSRIVMDTARSPEAEAEAAERLNLSRQG